MNNLETTVAATTETNIQQAVQTPFFAVSLTKLVVLSTCTIGLYEIFWFYKNWKLIKEQEQELKYILPFWRALFIHFYCYSLFKKVANKLEILGLGYLPTGLLALGYCVFILCSHLKDPYFFIGYLSVFFMLPIQSAINQINAIKAPGHNPNSQFSAWNIIAIIFGGVLNLLILVSIFTRIE